MCDPSCMRMLMCAALVATLTGCGELSVHRAHVVLEGDVQPWAELSEVLMSLESEVTTRYGDEVGEQFGQIKLHIYPSDGVIRRTTLPRQDEPTLLGLYEGNPFGRPTVHVRYNDDIYRTALLHELLQHQVPYLLSDRTDANSEHQHLWRDEMKEIFINVQNSAEAVEMMDNHAETAE